MFHQAFSSVGSSFRMVSEPVIDDDVTNEDISPMILVTRIADAKMFILHLITVEEEMSATFMS